MNVWKNRQQSTANQLANALAHNTRLEAALTKVHGIVAEYWGPCLGSVETLATIRDAMGKPAKGWRPIIDDGPGEEDGPWAEGWAGRSARDAATEQGK